MLLTRAGQGSYHKVEEVTMGGIQTIEEMRAAYPDEWVLIVDCEYDESRKLVRGRVAAHSPRRSDVHKEMLNHLLRNRAWRRYLMGNEDLIPFLAQNRLYCRVEESLCGSPCSRVWRPDGRNDETLLLRFHVV